MTGSVHNGGRLFDLRRAALAALLAAGVVFARGASAEDADDEYQAKIKSWEEALKSKSEEDRKKALFEMGTSFSGAMNKWQVAHDKLSRGVLKKDEAEIQAGGADVQKALTKMGEHNLLKKDPKDAQAVKDYSLQYNNLVNQTLDMIRKDPAKADTGKAETELATMEERIGFRFGKYYTDKKVLGMLQKAIGDKSISVKGLAVRMIGRAGDLGCSQAVLGLFSAIKANADKPEYRDLFCDTVYAMGDTNYPNSFLEIEKWVRSRVLNFDKNKRYATCAAINALGRFKYRDAVESLMKMYKSLSEKYVTENRTKEEKDACFAIHNELHLALIEVTGTSDPRRKSSAEESYSEWDRWWVKNKDRFPLPSLGKRS